MRFILTFLCLCTVHYATSQSWQSLGPRDTNIMTRSSSIEGEMVVSPTGTIFYLTYEISYDKLVIMQFVNNSWQLYCEVPGSQGCDNQSTSMVQDSNGNLYVYYRHFDNGLYYHQIKMYNGSQWINQGDFNQLNNLAVGSISDGRLKLDHSDTPYLLFQDSGLEYPLSLIKKSGDTWQHVGTSPLVGIPITSMMATQLIDFSFFSDNSPCVASAVYHDWTSNWNGVVVKKFDGTNWVNISETNPFMNIGNEHVDYSDISLRISSDDIPMLGYVYHESSTFMDHVGVRWYSNQSTNWENLDDIAIVGDYGRKVQLELDNENVPYLAFSSTPEQELAGIVKWYNNNWEQVGNFSTLTYSPNMAPWLYLDFSIQNGEIYFMAYYEYTQQAPQIGKITNDEYFAYGNLGVYGDMSLNSSVIYTDSDENIYLTGIDASTGQDYVTSFHFDNGNWQSTNQAAVPTIGSAGTYNVKRNHLGETFAVENVMDAAIIRQLINGHWEEVITLPELEIRDFEFDQNNVLHFTSLYHYSVNLNLHKKMTVGKLINSDIEVLFEQHYGDNDNEGTVIKSLNLTIDQNNTLYYSYMYDSNMLFWDAQMAVFRFEDGEWIAIETELDSYIPFIIGQDAIYTQSQIITDANNDLILQCNVSHSSAGNNTIFLFKFSNNEWVPMGEFPNHLIQTNTIYFTKGSTGDLYLGYIAMFPDGLAYFKLLKQSGSNWSEVGTQPFHAPIYAPFIDFNFYLSANDIPYFTYTDLTYRTWAFAFNPIEFSNTSLSENTLCIGTEFEISYGTTNGFVGANQQITAQLSDAQGSFANPITIGSVTGEASGVIMATIPVETPTGEGYQIRLVVDGLSIESESIGGDIAITGYLFYLDADGDGYGNPEEMMHSCEETIPTGYVTNNTDCNDSNAEEWQSISENVEIIWEDEIFVCLDAADITLVANPEGGTWSGEGIVNGLISPSSLNESNYTFTYEVAGDGLCYAGGQASLVLSFNDCTPIEYITYYQDLDGDGFGNPNVSIQFPVLVIPVGYVTDNTDCDDTNEEMHEVDLNEFTLEWSDDNTLCTTDPSIDVSIDFVQGYWSGQGYENNFFHPSELTPGVYELTYTIVGDGLCLMTNSASLFFTIINCEGEFPIFYQDLDGDGYGNPDVFVDDELEAPEGYVIDNTDCDDNDANVWTATPVNAEIVWNDDFILCLEQDDVTLFGLPSGGIWSGDVVDNMLSTQTLGVGNFEIHYTVQGAGGCSIDGTDTVLVQIVECGEDPSLFFLDLDNDGYGDPNYPVYSDGDRNGYVQNSDDCDDTNPDVWQAVGQEVSASFPLSTLCLNSQAVTLSATPEGGNWSGNGIESNTFNPYTAGVGVQTLTYTVQGDGACILDSFDSVQIEVEECADPIGIEDMDSLSIKVYPTITTDLITITAIHLAEISIIDSYSKLIETKKYNGDMVTISLGHLAAGMYFLKISGNDSSHVVRVIKQ